MTPPGAGTLQLLFSVRGTVHSAVTPGSIVAFRLGGADTLPDHDSLLHGSGAAADARYETEELAIGAVLSYPWHNAANPLDVNNDGFVTNLDLLLVINELNAHGQHALSVPPVNPPDPMEYWDVSGDNNVYANDALILINYLNSGSPILLAAPTGGSANDSPAGQDASSLPEAAVVDNTVPTASTESATDSSIVTSESPTAAAEPAESASAAAPAESAAVAGETPSEPAAAVAPEASTPAVPAPAPAAPVAAPLTISQIQPLVEQAISLWVSAGIDAQQLERLEQVQWQIDDLAGLELGRARDTVIVIDQDAAGLGWFVDVTPAGDEEFVSAEGRLSAVDTLMASQVDLLSVIAHELGHVLGLVDHYSMDSEDLMEGTIRPGERKLLRERALTWLLANEKNW
jgi:hypothetical protein